MWPDMDAERWGRCKPGSWAKAAMQLGPFENEQVRTLLSMTDSDIVVRVEARSKDGLVKVETQHLPTRLWQPLAERRKTFKLGKRRHDAEGQICGEHRRWVAADLQVNGGVIAEAYPGAEFRVLRLGEKITMGARSVSCAIGEWQKRDEDGDKVITITLCDEIPGGVARMEVRAAGAGRLTKLMTLTILDFGSK